MGVQVILLGIQTASRSNQSAALVREADEHVVLGRDFWGPPIFSPSVEGEHSKGIDAEAPAAHDVGARFGEAWIAKATGEDVAPLLEKRPKIPRELDYALITEAEKTLGPLRQRPERKREVRAGFWSAVSSGVPDREPGWSPISTTCRARGEEVQEAND